MTPDPIDPERVELLYEDREDGDRVSFELVERYPEGDGEAIEAYYQSLLGPDADLALTVDEGELLVEASTEEIPREFALAILASISSGIVERAEAEIEAARGDPRGFH